MSNTKFQRTTESLDPGSYGGSYKLIAGDPVLDFLNTISWRGLPRAHEWLSSYTNLVNWAHLAGLLPLAKKITLNKLGKKHPLPAQRVVKQAIQLRDALHSIMHSLRSSRTSSAQAISTFNSHFTTACRQLRLIPQSGKFAWTWNAQQHSLDEVLWPIVWAAGNFLTTPPLRQLGSCETCEWVFLDTTKNHTRKWCTMEDCGNRAKAKRHRARLHSKH